MVNENGKLSGLYRSLCVSTNVVSRYFHHEYVKNLGYMGTFCEIQCNGASWGPNCSIPCLCQNGGLCDPFDGFCRCANGYSGQYCLNKCEEVSAQELYLFCHCQVFLISLSCSHLEYCRDDMVQTVPTVATVRTVRIAMNLMGVVSVFLDILYVF